jgi:hypothetical protein
LKSEPGIFVTGVFNCLLLSAYRLLLLILPTGVS